MNHPFNIHRPFLDALRRESTPVVIYLINGVKLEGEVDGFDDEAVILRRGASNYPDAPQSSGSSQKRMIFRHAISTIFPLGPVRFSPEDRRGGREPYEGRGGHANANRRRYPPQTRGGSHYRQRPPEPGDRAREDYGGNYRNEPNYEGANYQEEAGYEEKAPVGDQAEHWSEEQE